MRLETADKDQKPKTAGEWGFTVPNIVVRVYEVYVMACHPWLHLRSREIACWLLGSIRTLKSYLLKRVSAGVETDARHF